MDNNTLIKDVDLNIFPECPSEYLHQGGTIGVICDRGGFKYIVTPPLVEVCEYLYDLNIRTLSAGSGDINEIGVWFEYCSLSEENKQIVNNLVQQGILQVCERGMPGRLSDGDIRVNIQVDFERDTIESASEKTITFVKSLV